jgi:hypothetical protein
MAKKQEEEKRKLYTVINDRLKEVHKQLLYLCVSREGNMLDQGTANVICGLRMNLFHLRSILFDLLFEEKKPGVILKEKGEFPDLIHLH